MKMVVDELINGGANVPQKEVDPSPSPSAIGTEFARQYYTLLVEAPANVHRFYSHESTLLLNDASFTGQQKIGLAIEGLIKENNSIRIKIDSIKGVATVNQGIALQVFGQMGGRRFAQTFILAQQGAKKYYVQNDLFFFLDYVFKATPETTTTEPHVPKKVTPAQNGHPAPISASPAPPSEETPILTSTSDVESEIQPPIEDVQEQPKPVQEKAASEKVKESTPEPVVKSPAPAPTPKAKEAPKPQPQPVVAPVADTTPKTWAKLVGGGGSKGTITSAPPSSPSVAPAKPVPAAAKTAPSPLKTQPNGTAAVQNGRPQQGQTGERRIYLGALVRNRVPETTSVAEQQIKDSFSKFGEVETVAMPRKVLDQPEDQSRYAFAFITMKTASDAQKVFNAAEKTERGHFHLPIKVEAFGFDGTVVISEQKPDRDRPAGFRGGRGGFAPRGGYAMRGRGGPGGRGGFRGGQAHNQSVSQN